MQSSPAAHAAQPVPRQVTADGSEVIRSAFGMPQIDIPQHGM